ncbi:hypothetical protein THOM_2441 [Trachipleistophora hominis]|uniref:Uncharacterized protein n=1 Tax=Trachipleistophora hominis TaxID=72359 RepID=L7JTH8_TRAHO|nr:hypothetical protein THOM_2441 [Trachipleistophora hominis]
MVQSLDTLKKARKRHVQTPVTTPKYLIALKSVTSFENDTYSLEDSVIEYVLAGDYTVFIVIVILVVCMVGILAGLIVWRRMYDKSKDCESCSTDSFVIDGDIGGSISDKVDDGEIDNIVRDSENDIDNNIDDYKNNDTVKNYEIDNGRCVDSYEAGGIKNNISGIDGLKKK